MSVSKSEVKVTLRPTATHRFRSPSNFTTDSQSSSMSYIEYPCGTCDQILVLVGIFLSDICGFVSIERPFWRENGSAICSVITQWSESVRTRNHTLLSHLRLPQHGGPGPRSYVPQEQGDPVIPPGTGFPLRPLLWLTSYDSQGCCGGILTLPLPGGIGPCTYSLQE
jgi:hypothetical protein